MKKLGMLLLSLAMLLLVLCGCGGSSSPAAAPPTTEAAGDTTTGAGNSYGDAGENYIQSDSALPGVVGEDPKAEEESRLQTAKLIYTANLELETIAFEQSDKDLATLVEQVGGYFEASSVNNYGNGYRSGSYTVRVPSAQFKPFCEQIGKLCHVTYKSSSAENVSEAYYDTESRLITQKTKLNRLQMLLAKADKMEDIITLESAISETELTIEQLSGTLRKYDALVDYATVYLTMSEVYKLSNTEEPASGFGQRMSTAFSSGWKNFTSGAEGLLVALAYGWPWLLTLAAVAAVVVTVLIRRGRSETKPPKSGGKGPTGTPPAPPLA